MGKRALQNYLSGLKKEEIEIQLMDLYERFPVVKEYYNFVFNPKEDQLIQEAKIKISNEYFPLKRKKPRARRSIAQKYIKHFIKLGVAPHLIADLMLYNVEVALSFSDHKNVPDSFYKSILNSFAQAVKYIAFNQFKVDFIDRILKVHASVQGQDWPNTEEFSHSLDLLE